MEPRSKRAKTEADNKQSSEAQLYQPSPRKVIYDTKMENTNTQGATRKSRQFYLFNQPLSKTGGNLPSPRASFQVPSAADIKSVKPDAVNHLSNMQIRWRQWGVGFTGLQGSPFSEISVGFGKRSDMEQKKAIKLNAGHAGKNGVAKSQKHTSNEYMFNKDFTWQNRKFDFSSEQKITFDSMAIFRIRQSVIRYYKAPHDCCLVQFFFESADGRILATLKSHEVPSNAVVLKYQVNSYKHDEEVLQPSEIISGVQINQDNTGANCSIQFLITDVGEAKKKNGF